MLSTTTKTTTQLLCKRVIQPTTATLNVNHAFASSINNQQQVRFRTGNRTRLWGRPKGHNFLRKGGKGSSQKNPPRYHNQIPAKEVMPDPLKVQLKRERIMDENEEENYKHFLSLFNREGVASPDYTEVVKFKDHPFVKLCLETSDEQWSKLTMFDIIELCGDQTMSPFEAHLALPVELKKMVWDWVERNMHTDLIKLNPMDIMSNNIGTNLLELEANRQIEIFSQPNVLNAMKNFESDVASKLKGTKLQKWNSYMQLIDHVRDNVDSVAHERMQLLRKGAEIDEMTSRMIAQRDGDLDDSLDGSDLDASSGDDGSAIVVDRVSNHKAEAYAHKMWLQGLNEVSAHAEHTKRYIESYNASIAFTEQDGDKLFELHKENPDYWTGDRLAASFGITRERAWGEILIREVDEAKRTGKPFCPEKIDYLFHRDESVIKTMKQRFTKNDSRSDYQFLREAYTGQIVDEDAIYQQFLEKTSKPIPASGLDDDLPEWVRRPFQPPRGSIRPTKVATEGVESTESLLYPRVESTSGLGTHTVRQRHRIIEMMSKSRVNSGEQRKFLILETDGTLRTMEEDTKEWICIKPLPYTKMGLGGKEKRREKFRKREF